jgi:hypothetical protein
MIQGGPVAAIDGPWIRGHGPGHAGVGGGFGVWRGRLAWGLLAVLMKIVGALASLGFAMQAVRGLGSLLGIGGASGGGLLAGAGMLARFGGPLALAALATEQVVATGRDIHGHATGDPNASWGRTLFNLSPMGQAHRLTGSGWLARQGYGASDWLHQSGMMPDAMHDLVQRGRQTAWARFNTGETLEQAGGMPEKIFGAPQDNVGHTGPHASFANTPGIVYLPGTQVPAMANNGANAALYANAGMNTLANKSLGGAPGAPGGGRKRTNDVDLDFNFQSQFIGLEDNLRRIQNGRP